MKNFAVICSMYLRSIKNPTTDIWTVILMPHEINYLKWKNGITYKKGFRYWFADEPDLIAAINQIFKAFPLPDANAWNNSNGRSSEIKRVQYSCNIAVENWLILALVQNNIVQWKDAYLCTKNPSKYADLMKSSMQCRSKPSPS